MMKHSPNGEDQMLNFFKEQLAIHRFKRSTLGQALRHHTQQYFYSETALSSFAEANKQKLIQDFMAKLAAIVSSPNQFLALREAIVEYTIPFAQLQVLCLTEAEKADTFYAANPYISGALYYDIREASDHNEELAKFKWETEGVDDTDLIAFANGRCALLLYYMNGFNMVRMESGDKAEKDWFRPFVEAMLVWEENTSREALNLPSLHSGIVDGLTYSAMMNYVADGAQNPFFEFRKNFPDRYLAGEGPLPAAREAQ